MNKQINKIQNKIENANLNDFPKQNGDRYILHLKWKLWKTLSKKITLKTKVVTRKLFILVRAVVLIYSFIASFICMRVSVFLCECAQTTESCCRGRGRRRSRCWYCCCVCYCCITFFMANNLLWMWSFYFMDQGKKWNRFKTARIWTLNIKKHFAWHFIN